MLCIIKLNISIYFRCSCVDFDFFSHRSIYISADELNLINGIQCQLIGRINIFYVDIVELQIKNC